MVEITVKAVDSASAMEEVEKRLGADALIVSTNRVDGQIEIVATNDEPSKYQKTLEPLILDRNYRIKGFSDILNSKLSDDDKPFGLKDSANLSQIAENAENIKQQASEVHARLKKFNDDFFSKIGTDLGRAIKSYNDGVRSWESRLMPSVRKIEEMGIADSTRKIEAPEEKQEIPIEKEVIKKLIKGDNVDMDQSGLSKREWNELMEAFDLKDKLI